MDSSFIDLDILLTHIREPRSRGYFLDAVRAYKAGALRAAISSGWVAVVYDLILKYRELSALGNAQATAYLRDWDTATTDQNTERLVKLESEILCHATREIQLLNPHALTHLKRFRQDRHRCAHPAFDTQSELFEPSPELVRLHLVNAIDLVLSQNPLQGKAILELFSIDVQSVGFPKDDFKIWDYVHERYLDRTRRQNIINFGTVLAKSLLRGVPEEWEKHSNKIIQALVAIRDRAPDSWPELFASIRMILNSLPPDDRLRGITFIAAFPDFWPELDAATRTILRETVENTTPEDLNLDDYIFLSRLKILELEQPMLRLINELPTKRLRDVISIEALPEFWSAALKCYKESDSFKESQNNFRDFILPFADTLTAEMFDSLLIVIEKQNQNWPAWRTPRFLLELLNTVSEENFPTHHGRSRFYLFLLRQHPTSGPQSWINVYGDVFESFEQDGWTPPSPPEAPTYEMGSSDEPV